MTGLQLMLPPFVACMILVAMLSYLGLHVIAREVIFVDLSLAQMAALGSLSALLMRNVRNVATMPSREWSTPSRPARRLPRQGCARWVLQAMTS